MCMAPAPDAISDRTVRATLNALPNPVSASTGTRARLATGGGGGGGPRHSRFGDRSADRELRGGGGSRWTEDTMGMQISVAGMERPRVARFKGLTPTKRGFVDTAIPGYERLIYNVIGRGVTEDPTLDPAITDARDFNLTLVKKVPGNRVGLHDHPTIEVFMPLTGRWCVYWGDEGEHDGFL